MQENTTTMMAQHVTNPTKSMQKAPPLQSWYTNDDAEDSDADCSFVSNDAKCMQGDWV